MECRKCFEEHSADMMYPFDQICVFCKHSTDKWDLGGETVTRSGDEQTTEEMKRMRARKKNKWK